MSGVCTVEGLVIGVQAARPCPEVKCEATENSARTQASLVSSAIVRADFAFLWLAPQ